MPRLQIQSVRFSIEADNRLKNLKAKTGITPNLLCRIGLCLSLDEPGMPVSDDSEASLRQIPRHVLLGDYDRLFVALLAVRHPDVQDPDDFERLFIAHIHRGVLLLANRVKDVSSLAELVPRSYLDQSASAPEAGGTFVEPSGEDEIEDV